MILVQKTWYGWRAIDDTEVVGLFDSPTVFRSRTHAGAVAKAKRRRGRLARRNNWLPVDTEDDR